MKTEISITNPNLDAETIATILSKIRTLKYFLSQTDYIVLKIAEGVVTREEYSEILQNRQTWRAEINNLEAIVDSLF